MAEYKPSIQRQLAVIAGFLGVALPSIAFSGFGYIWILEHWLHLDMDARPELSVEGLMQSLLLIAIIPIMLAGIFLAGIPWMFLMSRWLPWRDIEYFSKQRGPRIPLLSRWLDCLWEKMIEDRRPSSPETPFGR